MKLKPNFDLLGVLAKNFKSDMRPPYVAVFKVGNKTLVYMADAHDANKSYDMIDWCFDGDKFPRPDVMLVEFENVGREFKYNHSFNAYSLAYAAVRAAKANIPVVFADLSEEQMMRAVNAVSGQPITSDGLSDVLHLRADDALIGALSVARDTFMIKNIIAALEKYDVVWAIFGAGHYQEQKPVLIDMLGEPEYKRNIPNMRMDCAGIEVKPIVLIDNE